MSSSSAKPGKLKSEDNFVEPLSNDTSADLEPTSTDINEDNQDELRVLRPAFFLAGPRTRAFDFFLQGAKKENKQRGGSKNSSGGSNNSSNSGNNKAGQAAGSTVLPREMR